MTKTQALFIQWLKHAPPGTRFVYHTGYLPEGKKPQIAKVAWQFYEEGHIELAQRKVSEGVYDYIAQKRRRRRVPGARTNSQEMPNNRAKGGAQVHI